MIYTLVAVSAIWSISLLFKDHELIPSRG
jgi:hypothetical protein